MRIIKSSVSVNTSDNYTEVIILARLFSKMYTITNRIDSGDLAMSINIQSEVGLTRKDKYLNYITRTFPCL